MNFLCEDEASSTENKPGRETNNYHTITSKNATCSEQMMKDILNPKPIREGDIVIKKTAKPRSFRKRGSYKVI